MTARILLVAFVDTASIAPHASAAPTVPGFERFGRAEGADRVEAGLLLLGELGCTSCHAASEGQARHLTAAPPPRPTPSASEYE